MIWRFCVQLLSRLRISVPTKTSGCPVICCTEISPGILLVERGPDLLHRRFLIETHIHQRAALEIDPVASGRPSPPD